MSTLPVLAVGDVFAHALRGETCYLTSADGDRRRVPVENWTRPVNDADRALLALCDGPTIDLGCGPGRLTVELVGRGHVALGIDLVHEAVTQTRRRGGPALRRDLFGRLPGEGRWQTALLADGNVGIGGDPVALLERVRRLLAPDGRTVLEVEPPGARSQQLLTRLECHCAASTAFPWALLGADDVPAVARAAGFVQAERHPLGPHRWAVVLRAVTQ